VHANRRWRTVAWREHRDLSEKQKVVDNEGVRRLGSQGIELWHTFGRPAGSWIEDRWELLSQRGAVAARSVQHGFVGTLGHAGRRTPAHRERRQPRVRVAGRINGRARDVDTSCAQSGSADAPEAEVWAHACGSFAAVEKIREISFGNLKLVTRCHLHSGQAVPGCVFEARRAEKTIGGPAVHDEPLDRPDRLPYRKQT